MLGVLKNIIGSKGKSRNYEDFRFGEYPPSKKQFGYACSLGIEIKDGMTNYDLSDEINKAILIRELGITVTKKMDDRQIERMIVETPVSHQSIEVRESHWNRIADANTSALMIYEYKDKTVVDVFEINEAEIKGKKNQKLIISMAEPSICNDKDIGKNIEWEHVVKVPEETIWYFQPVIPRLELFDLAKYKTIINQGVKIAKRMEKAKKKARK